MSAPLHDVRIVEMGGYAPVAHAGQLLADLGADIVRIDRPGKGPGPSNLLDRGRRAVTVDLKEPEHRIEACQLIDRADVLVEGYRPGAMERLGLGPSDVWQTNPRLVFGRLSGWGQVGAMAPKAGHDINFLALSGLLHAMGSAGSTPRPPLNLVGDFGGGSVMLALGVVAALLGRERTGRGQVVDAAMSDGAVSLGSYVFSQFHDGGWSTARAANRLDGAHPCYRVYETSDGGFLAVGALEPVFRTSFLTTLELDSRDLDPDDPSTWEQLGDLIATRIKTRTRAEWERVFADVDACVTPVLGLDEAPAHPHHRGRGSFRQIDGWAQPGPCPRLSDHGDVVSRPGRAVTVAEIIEDWAPAEAAAAGRRGTL
jgi:alpha-methylacyl-CoA racemase